MLCFMFCLHFFWVYGSDRAGGLISGGQSVCGRVINTKCFRYTSVPAPDGLAGCTSKMGAMMNVACCFLPYGLSAALKWFGLN